MDAPSTVPSQTEGRLCRPGLLTHALLLQVNSLKALLHSPPVLVCAGPESFRPAALEGARRSGTETLSGQASQNKNGELVFEFLRCYLHGIVVQESWEDIVSRMKETCLWLQFLGN